MIIDMKVFLGLLYSDRRHIGLDVSRWPCMENTTAAILLVTLKLGQFSVNNVVFHISTLQLSIFQFSFKLRNVEFNLVVSVNLSLLKNSKFFRFNRVDHNKRFINVNIDLHQAHAIWTFFIPKIMVFE